VTGGKTRGSGKEGALATYLMLASYTDQGVRNIKDTLKREEGFRSFCGKLGAHVREIYRTLGQYDLASSWRPRTR
jgi:uncharacterized protein with GYD domain